MKEDEGIMKKGRDHEEMKEKKRRMDSHNPRRK